MSEKFIPGPLRFTTEDGYSYLRDEQGNSIMCNMNYYPWAPDEEEYWHLFAAAPELLAAAKLALEDCCDLIETKAGNALRAAIAKADGVSE